MSQQSLFEPVEIHARPMVSPLPPEGWQSLASHHPEPSVKQLLRLLRERGLIVVECDWLTEQWAMPDQQVLQTLTGAVP